MVRPGKAAASPRSTAASGAPSGGPGARRPAPLTCGPSRATADRDQEAKMRSATARRLVYGLAGLGLRAVAVVGTATMAPAAGPARTLADDADSGYGCEAHVSLTHH